MDYPQQHIKPYDEEGKKTEQVERMFDNIAHAYDKLNHTLSLGIDRSWRKKAIAWLRPFQPQRMMDVATGTGDFAILACRKLQPAELIGILIQINRFPIIQCKNSFGSTRQYLLGSQ